METREQIVEYVTKVYWHRGVPPSVREIMGALDLKSPSTVHRHLLTLAADGMLRRVRIGDGLAFFLPVNARSVTAREIDEAYNAGGIGAVKELVLG